MGNGTARLTTTGQKYTLKKKASFLGWKLAFMDGYAERKDTLFSPHGLPHPRFRLFAEVFAHRAEVDG